MIDNNIEDLIKQKTFGYDGICRIIPQRPPFLMIDKVLELDVEKHIAICQKCIGANEPYLQGHFPNNPVFPGVLMVEAMAQAASIIGKAMMNGKPGILLFASADEIKFLDTATAGDVLIVEAFVSKLRDPVVIGECKVSKKITNKDSNDELKVICTCKLKAFRKEL